MRGLAEGDGLDGAVGAGVDEPGPGRGVDCHRTNQTEYTLLTYSIIMNE